MSQTRYSSTPRVANFGGLSSRSIYELLISLSKGWRVPSILGLYSFVDICLPRWNEWLCVTMNSEVLAGRNWRASRLVSFGIDVKQERKKWIAQDETRNTKFVHVVSVTCVTVSSRFQAPVAFAQRLEWKVYHAQRIGTRGTEPTSASKYIEQ